MAIAQSYVNTHFYCSGFVYLQPHLSWKYIFSVGKVIFLTLQNKTSPLHMTRSQNAKKKYRGQREYGKIAKVRTTWQSLNSVISLYFILRLCTCSDNVMPFFLSKSAINFWFTFLFIYLFFPPSRIWCLSKSNSTTPRPSWNIKVRIVLLNRMLCFGCNHWLETCFFFFLSLGN